MKFSWMAIPLLIVPLTAAPAAAHGGSHGVGGHANRGFQPHAAAVAVPVYGYGGYYYAAPYAYAEPLADGSQAPPAPAPDVLVNPGYQPETANPVVRDYSNVQLPESAPLEERQAPPPAESIQQPRQPQQQSDPSPTLYLIAMKDGSIVAALGYWMEGDTLNYITRDANRNRVSIDRVDRELSAKLNAERNVPFKLD